MSPLRIRPRHPGTAVLLDRTSGAADDARSALLAANKLARDALVELQKVSPSQHNLDAIAMMDQVPGRLPPPPPSPPWRGLLEWFKSAPRTEVVITVSAVLSTVLTAVLLVQRPKPPIVITGGT